MFSVNKKISLIFKENFCVYEINSYLLDSKNVVPTNSLHFQVLQHLMDGLISLTLKSEDLQCTFFHYTARELLACAVMRPILNLANPR